MEFVRLPFQLGAEIGMGNINKLPGALADGLSIQVGDPILGDHIADMVAAGHDAGAELEHASDAGDGRSVS